jgi:hypothetical protein
VPTFSVERTCITLTFSTGGVAQSAKMMWPSPEMRVTLYCARIWAAPG